MGGKAAKLKPKTTEKSLFASTYSSTKMPPPTLPLTKLLSPKLARDSACVPRIPRGPNLPPLSILLARHGRSDSKCLYFLLEKLLLHNSDFRIIQTRGYCREMETTSILA